MSNVRWGLFLFAACLMGMSTAGALAADIFWANPLGGRWNDARNWKPAQVPGAADTAVIDLAGDYKVTADTAITVAGLTVSSAAGTPTLAVTAGTFALEGAGQVGRSAVLELAGGTLAGAGTLTVEGRMAWTAGTLQGGGRLVVPVRASLVLSGSGSKTLYARTVEVAGGLSWSGTGDLYTGNGAKLSILPGGLFDMQSDTLCRAWTGTPLTFVNAGVVRKSAGTGVSTFQMALQNDGSVEVTTGTVAWAGGLVNRGAVDVGTGAAVQFGGGVAAFTGESKLSGAGAFRLTAGSVSIDGPVVFPSFELSGSGILEGVGVLTVTGAMSWTGGTVRGAGRLVVPEGAVLTVGGTANKTLYERTVEIAGSLVWGGTGDWLTGNGAKLVIAKTGLLDLVTDSLFRAWTGTAMTVENAGTVRKSGGTGISAFQMAVQNAGVLVVRTGVLQLQNGGANSGAFDCEAGAVLQFSNGTLAARAGSTFVGKGIYRLSGGTLAVEGVLAVPLVEFTGGTLGGAGELTVGDRFAWTGGTLSGGGRVTVPTGAVLAMSGAGTKTLYDRTLEVAGTLSWTGTGDVFTGNGGTLSVLAGGVFEIQTDALLRHWTGTPIKFSNAGTIRKSVSTGTTTLQMALDHSGTVVVESGLLLLGAGGTTRGTMQTAVGTAVQFGGGTLTLQAGATFGGAGAFRQTQGTVSLEADVTIPIFELGGGELTGAGGLTVASQMAWTAGTLSGAGRVIIPVGAGLTVNGTGSKTLYARALEVGGTMLWTAGEFYTGNGGRLEVLKTGVFDIQSDLTLRHWTGTPIKWVLAGTLRKSATTGTTTVQMALDVAGGLVDVRSGTLVLSGGGQSTGEIRVEEAAAVHWTGGTFAALAGSRMAGAGRARVAGATVSLAGTFTAAGLTVANGTFNADVDLSLPELELAGGTFSGTGAVVVTGRMMWTGGTLTGGGSLTIPVGVTAAWTGNGSKTLYERTLLVAGSLVWNGGGDVYTGNGGRIEIARGGVFDVQNDQILRHWTGTPIKLVIGGTLRKTMGVGTTLVQMAPDIAGGSLEVQSGTVVLSGGGQSTGTLRVVEGAAVHFTGGTFTSLAGSSITGEGECRVAGAAVTVAGTYGLPRLAVANGSFALEADTTVGEVEFSGGTITGAAALTIGRKLTWTSGTLSGPGPLSVPLDALVSWEGNGSKTLYERVVQLAGTWQWSGAGDGFTGNNATWNVLKSGVFEIRNDQLLRHWTGSPMRFVNAGTIRKVGGSGTTTFQMALVNSGDVAVDSGTVSFAGGGSSSGNIRAVLGSTVLFPGGTFTLQPGAVLAGEGVYRSTGTTLEAATDVVLPSFEMTSGVLTGPGVITLGGRMDWSGGSILGAGRLLVPAGRTLTALGNGSKTLYERAVEVGGTLVWKDGGDIYTGNAAQLTILPGGVFDIQNDALFRHWTGTRLAFQNQGTMRKSAGKAVTTFQPSLVNRGVLELSAGSMSPTGGYVSGPESLLRLTVAGVTPTTEFTRLAVSGAALLDGVLEVNLSRGFQPAIDSRLLVMTYGSRTGVFTRVVPSPGWVADPNYLATGLEIITRQVNSVNTPPTFAGLTDITLGLGETRLVPFKIADAESPADALTLSVVSENPEILPDTALIVAGRGGDRTLSVVASSRRTGVARVRVTLSDGVNTTTANLVVTLTTAPIAGCISQPAGLVGWWRAEGDATDSAGNRPGTLRGGTTYAPGKVGLAFQFDGVDDVVDTGAWTVGNRWTLEAWVNASATPGGRYAFAGGVAECLDWALGLENGRWGAIIRPASGTCTATLVSPDPVEIGRWYHVAATCDGRTVTLYVDGVAKGSAPVVVDGVGTSSGMWIGGAVCCAGERFAGLVDEVSVYSRALTAGEIEALQRSGSAGKCLQKPLDPETVAVGSALAFDGKDDYVALADAASLRPASLTVEGWFSFSSVAGLQSLVAKTVGSGILNSYALWFENGRLLGAVGNAQAGSAPVSAPFAPVAGRWYHLALTFDAKTAVATLVVDGARAASAVMTQLPGYDRHPLLLGASIENEVVALFFAGRMDEVRVWNIARSEAELAADAKRTLLGNEAGLVAYLRFEDRVGGAVLDGTALKNHGLLGGGSLANQPAVVGSTVGGGQAIVTRENKDVAIGLAGSVEVLGAFATIERLPVRGVLYQTPDGVNRGAAIRSVPARVTHAGLKVIYAPPSNTAGDNLDNFAFTLSDGASTTPVAVVTISVQGVPPLVLVQPLSQTVRGGVEVAFRVEARGSAPLSYQWLFNGNPVAGATESLLRLPNVGAAASGSYAVRVTNPLGTVLSDTAGLKVLVAPVLTRQPVGQGVALGGAVTLSVEATGDAPLTYQWRRNGLNIRGATAASLPIVAFRIEDAGSYSVIVGSPNGAVISDPAILRPELPVLDLRNDFAARQRLAGALGTGLGNNRGANREAGEPNHAGKRGGSSVWVSWVAPLGGQVGFTTTGSQIDTLLAVYTGNALNTLTLVASDDDSGGFFGSAVRFNATAGQEFHLAIDGLAGETGDIVLSWALVPSAIRLPEVVRLPQSRVAVEGENVVFEVSAVDPSSTPLPLTFQWLFNGVEIAGATTARLTLNAVSAAQVGAYAVRVTGQGLSVTTPPATLQITSRPDVAAEQAVLSDDKFADAAPIVSPAPGLLAGLRDRPLWLPRGGLASGYSGTQVFSTAGSSTEGGEPNHCGVIGGASQWFSYRAEATGTLIISTDGSDFDTVLAVYTGPGTDFSSLVQVACDDNGGTDRLDSRVEVEAVAGTIYYVAVDGVAGAFGNVALNYTLAVPLQLAPLPGGAGALRLRLSGQPGWTHTLERSLDLLNWTTLATTNSASGLMEFTDELPAETQRFYRAVRLP